MSGRLTMGHHQPSAYRANTPRDSNSVSREFRFPRGDFVQTLRDILAVLAAALLVLVTGLAISASIILCFLVRF